jgi:hypothetical protein
LISSIALFSLAVFWTNGQWMAESISIDMSLREYGNYLWFTGIAFLGIASSILLFRILKISWGLLLFIGENSVVFYLLNGLNIFVLDNYILAKGWVPAETLPAILFSIGYAVISQILFLPLAFLLVKYAPLLVGRHKFSKPAKV